MRITLSSRDFWWVGINFRSEKQAAGTDTAGGCLVWPLRISGLQKWSLYYLNVELAEFQDPSGHHYTFTLPAVLSPLKLFDKLRCTR